MGKCNRDTSIELVALVQEFQFASKVHPLIYASSESEITKEAFTERSKE